MKKYTKPQIEITNFSIDSTIATDVLTTSANITSFNTNIFVNRNF